VASLSLSLLLFSSSFPCLFFFSPSPFRPMAVRCGAVRCGAVR
jgi:hypothetical protein